MNNLVKKIVGKVTRTRIIPNDELAYSTIKLKRVVRKPVNKMATSDADENGAQIALNSISDAVFYTDMLGNINYLNFAAEKLTGWCLISSTAPHAKPHLIRCQWY